MNGNRVAVLAAAALLAAACSKPEPVPAPAPAPEKAPEPKPSGGGMDLSLAPSAGAKPASGGEPAGNAKPAPEKPEGPPPPASPDEISDTEVLMTWSQEEQEALNEMPAEEKAKEIQKRRLKIFRDRGGVLDPDAASGSIAERPPDERTGERGPARPDVVKEKDLPPPELREILLDLGSSDPELRARGAESARRFPDTTVAAKYVIPLLEDKDPDLRAIAASTLGDIKSTDAVAPLTALLKKVGEKDQVRAMAMKALGDIGGPKAREALRDLVQNASESSDKAAALGMLIRQKEVGDLKALIPAALQELNADVRMQAILAIREFKLQGFEKEVIERMEDASQLVAQEAMRCLGELGSHRAVPALIRILLKPYAEADDPEALQDAANNALEKITGTTQGYESTHDELRTAAIDNWRLWWEKNKATWK